MKLLYKYVPIIAICLLSLHSYAQKASINIRGSVRDEQNKPLDFVTVKLKEADRVTYTDQEGKFSFNLNPGELKTLSLSVAMVGKAGKDTSIVLANFSKELHIVLKNLTLKLEEVQISEERKILSSNSSILFGRQAIEQIQAFSLADILNNLPGKTITPPNLQNPLNITLRGQASGLHNLNNSMGVAIILDDIQQSNNANMQNLNVGKYGMMGSGIKSKSYGGFDVSFSGIDIREIPADNIESIEVISGIAPAKYGDLTDGAVIINRKAGKTNFQLTSRINASTTNFSLSKGFQLPGKSGALNLSLNYLLSEQDPSDPLKSYKRISTGLMWSTRLSKMIKNTFSIDFNTRLDNVKKDPDVGQDYMTYAKTRNLSISNRTSIQINGAIVKSLDFSAGYSSAFQESYDQEYLNREPTPIADKDTIGLYEGYFIPGNYVAVDHVKGNPKNLNGNISLNNEFTTGNLIHRLSLGANVYYSANDGEGIIIDPKTPRWANRSYQNERPYAYESLPSVFNYALYLQDGFKFDFLKRQMNVNAGLRYDIQNNIGTLQPRINMNYALAKRFGINAAFGLSTKSPSLSIRYPAPVYFDIPVHTSFTGFDIESLFLVYTDKIVPDNSKVKPSRSSQLEFGLTYKDNFFTSSLTTYYKQNKDGFSNQNNYRTYTTEEYTYVYNQGQRPGYFPNGKQKDWITSYNTSANDLRSNNFGIEWIISTKKIAAIQTSFNLSNSFGYSSSKLNSEYVQKPDPQYTTDSYKGWFGVYKGKETDNYMITSKLSTTTHIPKLGFVVNLRADIFWQSYERILNDTYLPIAWMDKKMVRHEIPIFDPGNTDYNYLALSSAANAAIKQPFVYANLSMSVAKEIGKYIKMSLSANNVFNIRNRYYNPNTNKSTNYTYPVSVGAELSIKF